MSAKRVSAQGGAICPGGCLPRVGVSAPPWTEFLTHARENNYLSAATLADGNKVYFHDFLKIVCSKNLNVVNLVLLADRQKIYPPSIQSLIFRVSLTVNTFSSTKIVLCFRESMCCL